MRYLNYLSLISLMVFTTSCEMINFHHLSKVENTALLSVYCDKQIEISGFKQFTSLNKELAQSNSFNLTPAASLIKNKIIHQYQKTLPFKFVAENEVIDSASYKFLKKNFSNQIDDALNFQVPNGYTTIKQQDVTQIRQLLDELFVADTGLVVGNNFKLEMTKNSNQKDTMKIKSLLSLELRNRNGGLVLKTTFSGYSKNNITVSQQGRVDLTQFQPLCLEATQNALGELEHWLQKHTTDFEQLQKSNQMLGYLHHEKNRSFCVASRYSLPEQMSTCEL